MNAYIRFVAILSCLCGIAAGAMLVISVLVVCQMVAFRYILVEPTTWQTEFVTYLLLSATFVGAPYLLLTKGHVNVDLVPIYLNPRARFVLALVASTLSLVFCVTITWLGLNLWLEAWNNSWHSDSMWEVRLWIPYLAMPIGFGVLSLQYIADLFSLILRHEMPFGISEEDVE
ncbi:MAG: TRAP transporter small permease [Thiohalomonadales bacterium]|nr:TRAP transporter small permease [Thiohalomonadales bacterium]